MEISHLDFMLPLEKTDHPLMERFRPIFAEGFLDTATSRVHSFVRTRITKKTQ